MDITVIVYQRSGHYSAFFLYSGCCAQPTGVIIQNEIFRCKQKLEENFDEFIKRAKEEARKEKITFVHNLDDWVSIYHLKVFLFQSTLFFIKLPWKTLGATLSLVKQKN